MIFLLSVLKCGRFAGQMLFFVTRTKIRNSNIDADQGQGGHKAMPLDMVILQCIMIQNHSLWILARHTAAVPAAKLRTSTKTTLPSQGYEPGYIAWRASALTTTPREFTICWALKCEYKCKSAMSVQGGCEHCRIEPTA